MTEHYKIWKFNSAEKYSGEKFGWSNREVWQKESRPEWREVKAGCLWEGQVSVLQNKKTVPPRADPAGKVCGAATSLALRGKPLPKLSAH